MGNLSIGLRPWLLSVGSDFSECVEEERGKLEQGEGRLLGARVI